MNEIPVVRAEISIVGHDFNVMLAQALREAAVLLGAVWDSEAGLWIGPHGLALEVELAGPVEAETMSVARAHAPTVTSVSRWRATYIVKSGL